MSEQINAFLYRDQSLGTIRAVADGTTFGRIESEDYATNRDAWRDLVSRMARRLTESRELRKDSEQRIAELQRQRDEATAARTGAERRIAQLERALADADDIAEAVTRERDQLRRDVDVMSKKTAEMAGGEWFDELERTRAELEGVNEEFRFTVAANTEAWDEVRAYKDQNRQLRAELEQVRKELREAPATAVVSGQGPAAAKAAKAAEAAERAIEADSGQVRAYIALAHAWVEIAKLPGEEKQ